LHINIWGTWAIRPQPWVSHPAIGTYNLVITRLRLKVRLRNSSLSCHLRCFLMDGVSLRGWLWRTLGNPLADAHHADGSPCHHSSPFALHRAPQRGRLAGGWSFANTISDPTMKATEIDFLHVEMWKIRSEARKDIDTKANKSWLSLKNSHVH
jgi:hypothetical protein